MWWSASMFIILHIRGKYGFRGFLCLLYGYDLYYCWHLIHIYLAARYVPAGYWTVSLLHIKCRPKWALMNKSAAKSLYDHHLHEVLNTARVSYNSLGDLHRNVQTEETNRDPSILWFTGYSCHRTLFLCSIICMLHDRPCNSWNISNTDYISPLLSPQAVVLLFYSAQSAEMGK